MANDCVGIWDDWTPCEANCNDLTLKTLQNNEIETYKIGYRTSRYRIITSASIGGKSCNIEDGKIDTDNNCLKKCNIYCSEWSECDCNTNIVTRNCNGIIETKICNNKNCDYINVFNYIINFFNLIILFFINLLK